jgi:hypothetical protein
VIDIQSIPLRPAEETDTVPPAHHAADGLDEMARDLSL